MMVDLAKRPGADPVTLREIAVSTGISRPYLDQVAIGLKTAALILSTRGRGGGYQLARPAEEISLRQVIEAGIGPINVVDCVMRPEICDRSDCCECRWVYQRINHEITNLLNGMSLSDLAQRKMDESERRGPGCVPRSACNPTTLE
jgi:Rrf2 family protein